MAEVASGQSPPLRAWKLGLNTSHGVPSPKYDMDAYMATILEVRPGTCVASWVEQKARPNSQPKYRKHFA